MAACSATTNMPGVGRLSCMLQYNHPAFHEWHGHEGQVVIAASWADERRRIGFAELNGLRTMLSGVEVADTDGTALAIFGWLSQRPQVLAAVTKLLR